MQTAEWIDELFPVVLDADIYEFSFHLVGEQKRRLVRTNREHIRDLSVTLVDAAVGQQNTAELWDWQLVAID